MVQQEITELKRRWNDILRVQWGSRLKWCERTLTTKASSSTAADNQPGVESQKEGQEQAVMVTAPAKARRLVPPQTLCRREQEVHYHLCQGNKRRKGLHQGDQEADK